MTNEFLVLTAIRLILPFFLLRWPIATFLVSIVVDTEDFDYLNLQTTADYDFYQQWDKMIDTYFLGFLAFVAWRWKDKIAKRIAIFFFLYRLAGVILQTVTGNREFLFWFPSFLPLLFIMYFVFWKISGTYNFFDSKKNTVIILFSILFPTIVQEFFMHIKMSPPADVFGIPRYFVGPLDVSFWAPWVMLPMLPVFVVLWKVKKAKVGKK
ncbi:MAG: hypothetical protein WD988_02585 [Candidatus Curtissbacteria bacterium]